MRRFTKEPFNYESDASWLLERIRVTDDYSGDFGKLGVIVDFSNSHGLCFGVTFPNVHGRNGRSYLERPPQQYLDVEWFDPWQVEIIHDEMD